MAGSSVRERLCHEGERAKEAQGTPPVAQSWGLIRAHTPIIVCACLNRRDLEHLGTTVQRSHSYICSAIMTKNMKMHNEA